MRKQLIINGFVARPSKDGYKFADLPEDLCKKLCEMTDLGIQFSNESRYNYSCNGTNMHKGFRFGTAKSAFWFACIEAFGNKIKSIQIKTLTNEQ